MKGIEGGLMGIEQLRAREQLRAPLTPPALGGVLRLSMDAGELNVKTGDPRKFFELKTLLKKFSRKFSKVLT